VKRSFVRLFKPQFAELVRTGAKQQTLRPVPKRMPKPGDALSLRCWTGRPYRSAQVVLRNAEVTKVSSVRIWQCGIEVAGVRLSDSGMRLFALADGFACVQEMLDWFHETHGLPFAGIVIQWALINEGGAR
jgi:hypothetical protein